MMRLHFLAVCLSLCATMSFAAEPPDPEKSAGEMIKPAEPAIDAGLKWLAGRQNADGSFGSGAQRSNASAITGLCGMAFLSGGSTPGRGPYGAQVQSAVAYLLSVAQPNGVICESVATAQGPMYCHGFATLFLAECYGMSPNPQLRAKLAAAIKLIVDTQNKERSDAKAGGWRYNPKIEEQGADISITVCQVMALRAAHNAGIHVPKDTFDRAVKYVIDSQNLDGGFMYQLVAGGESAFPRSAAALVALNSAGIYQSQAKGQSLKSNSPQNQPEQVAIKKGLDYLDQFRPQRGVARQGQYFEYGHYYAVQAMWQAGGERWAKWYPAIRDDLVDHQDQRTGAWLGQNFGDECATAMCLLVLQMPENQLPIFQR